MARAIQQFGKTAWGFISPPDSKVADNSQQSSAQVGSTESLQQTLIGKLLEKISAKSSPTNDEPEPSWKASDFLTNTPIPPGPMLLPQLSHRNAGKFLRSAPKLQQQELIAEMHVIRAKCFWLARDYKAMAESAQKALDQSNELSSPAYTAKACVYLAIAQFGLKDFDQGHRYLISAEKSKGAVREGELIPWIKHEANLYKLRSGKRNSSSSSSNNSNSRSSNEVIPTKPTKVPVVPKETKHRGDRKTSGTQPNVPGRNWYRNRRNTSGSPPGGESGERRVSSAHAAVYARMRKRRVSSEESSSSFGGNSRQALGAELGEILEDVREDE